MLTIIIPTHQSERVLVPTLAALVAGAVAGVVSEVVIADAQSTDATSAIADAAGCVVLQSDASLAARLRAAADSARAPWLLFLRPGFVPDANWIDEVVRYAEASGVATSGEVGAATFRPGLGGSTQRSAVRGAAALLWRAITRPLDPAQGLLIAKRVYGEIGGHRDGVADPEADLLRRIGARRITVLDCGGTAPSPG